MNILFIGGAGFIDSHTAVYFLVAMVKAFEKVNGVPVPYRIAPRRDGDIAVCYSDASKAKELLGWQA